MMTVIQCSIEGCLETFSTDQFCSESVRFTCRKHTGVDVKNKGIRLQEYQHDKELYHAGGDKPEGTKHIPDGRHIHQNPEPEEIPEFSL